MALEGMLVIMFTPSLGTALTNPVPELTALVKAAGVLVRALAPALRALPVNLKAVTGTWPTVLMAELPRLTTWRGVSLITLTVLAGASRIPATPKLVKVFRVEGTELMVSTVRSDTVLTVWGTLSTPLTAASETTLRASGTE